MKTTLKLIAKISFILLVPLLVWLSCETHKIDLLEPETIFEEPGVASNVVNAETGEPIPECTITFNNQVVNTDENGEFAFEIDYSPGEYILTAEAEGYLECPIAVKVTSTLTALNSIFLKKLGTEQTITHSGGEISEQFDDGRTFTIIIPENSFTEPTKLRLTPFEGPEAGSIINDIFPFAQFDITIENNNTPLLPLTIRLPAVFPLTEADIIYLVKVNSDFRSTTVVNTAPLILSEGNIVEVTITEPGRYILTGDDIYNETLISSSSELINEETKITNKIQKIEIPANSTKIFFETDNITQSAIKFINSLQKQIYGYNFEKRNIVTIYLSFKPEIILSKQEFNWVEIPDPDLVVHYIGPEDRCNQLGYHMVIIDSYLSKFSDKGAKVIYPPNFSNPIAIVLDSKTDHLFIEYYCKHYSGKSSYF